MEIELKNNMKKGILSRCQQIDIFLWFDNIILKEIIGETILDTLELDVSNLPNPL